ncbi:MAG: spermidine synthase [Planctomycetota bacterium]|nr:MAG: spermidine synthase [Planctomycetota bacterium]
MAPAADSIDSAASVCCARSSLHRLRGTDFHGISTNLHRLPEAKLWLMNEHRPLDAESDSPGGDGVADPTPAAQTTSGRGPTGASEPDPPPTSPAGTSHGVLGAFGAVPGARRIRWTCNLLVFLSSMAIMVLELTASRLIAKHVGSSLYTWTSVIGVVLAGMTLGNFLGGWLADRFHPRRLLPWLFAVCSVLCFSVLWLDSLMLSLERPDFLDWPSWILLIVAAIFLLPALALGTISPVVASLALLYSRHTGVTVGNVYAWGALGSIVGTFVAGFYLIDMMGTRAIVAVTSAVLAIICVLTSRASPLLRTAVAVGWLQFVAVFGTVAAFDEAMFAPRVDPIPSRVFDVPFDPGIRDTMLASLLAWSTSERSGRTAEQVVSERPDAPSTSASPPVAITAAADEQATAPVAEDSPLVDDDTQQLIDACRTLGRKLHLRDDIRGFYRDESSYSYIFVGSTVEDGHDVRYLQLDKLIHSYFDPQRPTELYYEYEQIYAAVTEAALRQHHRETRVTLPAETFAAWPSELPGGIVADRRHGQVVVTASHGLTDAERRDLLRDNPVAPLLDALRRLVATSNGPGWSGFAAEPLESLPGGMQWPQELKGKLHYDATLKMLNAYSPVTVDDLRSVWRAVPAATALHAAAAAELLYHQSRRVRTFFIGGGGFVFPRWIEARYPFRPLIHVAEIDPAVKEAVHRALGLPREPDTAVRTAIGDARNVVADRVRANRQRREAGQPEIRYDFVYGDAFNDFSVPWHLTTLEFAHLVKRLLAEDGVFLVNVIDQLPRTTLKGPDDGWFRSLPDGLRPSEFPAQTWCSCPAPFHGVEVRRARTDDRFRIAIRGCLPPQTAEALRRLASDDPAFAESVASALERAKRKRSGQFVARYMNTLAKLFRHVYVYATDPEVPSARRDTFVIVASDVPLDLTATALAEAGADAFWQGQPFAEIHAGRPAGYAAVLRELSGGMTLTDDFAPVDNLLLPVFARQDD